MDLRRGDQRARAAKLGRLYTTGRSSQFGHLAMPKRGLHMPPHEGPDPSIDPEEVARFDRLGEDWWNPHGPMRALHQFNPVRVECLRQLLSRRFGKVSGGGEHADRPLAGIAILDI